MDPKDIVIEEVKEFSEEVVAAVQHLITLEGSHYQPFSDDDLKEMIQNPHGFLYIARDASTKAIAGMVFLAIYRIPYAKKAYIDDVVIDEKFRGRGVATRLLEKSIEEAKKHQVSYVMLTAHPTRVANNLYEKLGFQKRETNVYRLYI